MKVSVKLLSTILLGASVLAGCGGDKKSEGSFEQEENAFISFPASNDKSLVKAEEIKAGVYGISQIKTALIIDEAKASYAFQQDMATVGLPANGDKVQSKKNVDELKKKLEDQNATFWPYIEFNMPLEITGGANSSFDEERYYWSQWKTEAADNQGWGWSMSSGPRAAYIFASEIVEQGTVKGKGVYQATISGVKLEAALVEVSDSELKAFVRYDVPVQDMGQAKALIELTYKKM